MALSFPFSANTHTSIFCFLSLFLFYLNGVPVYGEKIAHMTHHVHTVNASSLDPNPYCNESTRDHSKRGTLKVVNRYGPCSHLNQDEVSTPTFAEFMSQDHSRVNSIHNRLRVNSARNGLDGSKSTLSDSDQSNHFNFGYIATVGFGTPKKDLTLQLNTGSDVTWIQCLPCKSCYRQQEPIFNPSTSQTYKNLTCTSPQCSQLSAATGFQDCDANTCVYGAAYGDGSFTTGFFATDTLTLTATDVIPNFTFGCGLNNTGLFRGTAGLIGLGRNRLSLVEQTALTYGNYFSYCLPTPSSSGTLVFGGPTNNVSLKYTPLLTKSNGPSFYFIDVVGIKVGGQKLCICPSVFNTSGTIIDSGTVITRLQPEAYAALRTSFRQHMMNYTMTQVLSMFDTCYNLSGHDKVVVPEISFLFGGDVEVPIPFPGILYSVGQMQACLAFAGNSDASDVGIFGNLQQQTMDVAYDVAGGQLGFGTGGCS